MHARDRSATETCLSLPEVVQQIGSYLFEPIDLYEASCVNRLWCAALLPLRSQYPHVTLEHLPSFLSFLQSNRRVVHHCRALRILSDDLDDGQDSDAESDAESDSDSISISTANSDVEMNREGEDPAIRTGRTLTKRTKPAPMDLNAVAGVMNYLAAGGRLQFFMYALPGEPQRALPDDAWLALRRMSDSLQGLYIEVVGKHWDIVLASRFSNLTYLRLFLDTEEEIMTDGRGQAFDPKSALIAFLQSHPRLEVLHLYLGTCFANLDLSLVRLPLLRSFLLISKAEDVNIAPFIVSHPTLRSLDVYTDTEIIPFPAESLPNITALQVSAMTVPWFINVLDTAAKRSQPIRHLQVTAARQQNFHDVLSLSAPLGATLRCLELIFWSRDVPLLKVLEDVNRVFPKLVEISLFIPSWGSAEWEEEGKPLDLTTMLECFAQNTDLLAFSISDPQTELLTAEQVAAVPISCVPPRLKYVIWRSQTFRIRRRQTTTSDGEVITILEAERTYHPRNFRGNQYLRDWHEEMVLDHLAGNYEEQLKLC
ncbi:hypothetical protein ACEPAI_8944 [Sanghuangporus weigelae]